MEPSGSPFGAMPAKTTTNKKKRITPTVVVISDEATDSPDGISTMSVAGSGPAEPSVASSASPRAGKRKNRAPLDKEDAFLDVSISAPPKRSKGNNEQQYNSASLHPFAFFISSPPSSYAPLYSKLGEWFEGAVNADFNPGEHPLDLDVLKTIPNLSQTGRSDWANLMQECANINNLDDLWAKLTIVDKVISLCDEDEWRQVNLPWAKLQQDVWWVKTANSWFVQRFSLSTEDYMSMGLGALILELWYRFIWARYTIEVHAKLVAENQSRPASQPNSTKSSFHAAEPLGLGSQDRMDDDEDDDEAILEKSDLGEGDESESEAESVGGMDDEEIDVVPLRRRRPEPVQADVEMSEASAQHASSPSSTIKAAKPRTPFRRSTSPVSSPAAIGASSSDNGDARMQFDDSSSLAPQVGSAPESVSPSALEQAPSVADTDALMSEANPETTPNELSNQDSSDENDENQSPGDLLSTVANPPAPRRGTGPSIPEEEYEESSAVDIPPAVSLFFPHPAVRHCIDDIEAVVLAQEGEWNISKALDMFVDLVDHKNTETKFQQRSSSSSADQQARLLSRKQIRARLEHFYMTKYVPFLNEVGIKVSGDGMHVWKVQPEFSLFYDVTLVSTFSNLSQAGQAMSRNFMQLFPRLALSSDSRSQTYVTQVCYQIHSDLQQKGKITPEIDGLISLLDQLIDEKTAILRQLGPRPEDDDAMQEDSDDEEESSGSRENSLHRNISTASLRAGAAQVILQRVAASRENRLKEIEQMIEAIKEEFNKQTGNIDKVPPKKLETFELKLAAASGRTSPSLQSVSMSSQGSGSSQIKQETQTQDSSQVLSNVDVMLTDIMERQQISSPPPENH